MALPLPITLLGCDFSSSPSQRKPIVVACGQSHAGRVQITDIKRFTTLHDWGQWLAEPGHWVGGFDLPFGLPRELVQTLGWPAHRNFKRPRPRGLVAQPRSRAGQPMPANAGL